MRILIDSVLLNVSTCYCIVDYVALIVHAGNQNTIEKLFLEEFYVFIHCIVCLYIMNSISWHSKCSQVLLYSG